MVEWGKAGGSAEVLKRSHKVEALRLPLFPVPSYPTWLPPHWHPSNSHPFITVSLINILSSLYHTLQDSITKPWRKQKFIYSIYIFDINLFVKLWDYTTRQNYCPLLSYYTVQNVCKWRQNIPSHNWSSTKANWRGKKRFFKGFIHSSVFIWQTNVHKIWDNK